jgi:hypothetical protein
MASRGERNTRFFYNLEKKHFTAKHISKWVVENNQVIQDPKAILTEQTLFDEKLYKRHEALHNELYLNNDNPFISKPSQAEVNSCEGKITLQECLGALKNMKHYKFARHRWLYSWIVCKKLEWHKVPLT